MFRAPLRGEQQRFVGDGATPADLAGEQGGGCWRLAAKLARRHDDIHEPSPGQCEQARHGRFGVTTTRME